MQDLVDNFVNYYQNRQITMRNSRLNKFFNNNSKSALNLITERNYISEIHSQKVKEPKIITIDLREKDKQSYFIICNDKTIFVILESNLQVIKSFFLNNEEAELITLSEKAHSVFTKRMNQSINGDFQIFLVDQQMQEEIENFSENFQLNNYDLTRFWKLIRNCFVGYLIKKSHIQSFTDRIVNSENYFLTENINENFKSEEFIRLSRLGYSSSSSVYLTYCIKNEKLYVLKIFTNDENDENGKKDKLYSREYENYLDVHHPYLLKCYGHVDKYIVLEYIDGLTLDSIAETLSIKEKVKIIFSILIIIQYLHQKQYIYRDLKPSNIMVDKNGTVILIDLDRMVKNLAYDHKKQTESSVKMSGFFAPEIQKGEPYSYEADIYSIGKLINFLFENELLTEQFSELRKISDKCVEINPEKRPNIGYLIDNFYFLYFSNICEETNEKDTIQNIKQIHNYQCMKYWFYLSECHHSYSLNKLADIYCKHDIIPANDFKSKKYSLLGSIYLESECIIHDVDKGFFFFKPSKKTKQFRVS